ncbi:hypothetical protein AB4084_34485, partial [Lysobacter sp. 2RAB21]
SRRCACGVAGAGQANLSLGFVSPFVAAAPAVALQERHKPRPHRFKNGVCDDAKAQASISRITPAAIAPADTCQRSSLQAPNRRWR